MRIVLNLFVILFLLNFNNVFSIEYHVQKNDKNVVKFISKAPIEDFEGITSKIDGYFKYNNADLTDGEVYFEVDLRKISTDNGLRDRHMRDNYLHTDKYPYASFSGKITKSIKKGNDKSGETFEVESNGKFKVHGKEKEIVVKAIVTLGDKPNISARFNVSLPDHNIEVPSLMFQKISDIMKIEADFMLKLANK